MANETAPNGKKDKLTIKRLVSNVGFLVSQAMRLDAPTVIFVFIAFVFCTAGYSLVDTFLFKRLIDSLSDGSATFGSVAAIAGIIACTAALVQLMDSGAQMLAGARFVKLVGRMQETFIRKASGIDLACYDNSSYYDDFVIAASQADEMISTGVFAVARILGNVAGILTAGIFILSLKPIIALIPIAGFVVNIVTRFAITRTEYEYDMERRRLMRRADYSRRVFYQPEYAKEIKLSSVDKPLRRQFDAAIDEIEAKARKAGVKIAVLSLINWIVVFTCLSLFLAPLYLAYLVLKKKSLTFGSMVAMDNAQNNVRNQLDGMNYALVDFQRVGQFAERFRHFMDYEAKIESRPGTVTLPPAAKRADAALAIENLTFRYEGAAADTLTDVSLTVRPGERVAIVGENGAGKSTFIKLLMRLYEPTAGSIRYAGRDCREYSTNDWRSLFGAVFQDYQLYGTSLAENVIMGERADVSRPAETRPQQDERVRRALELADFDRKLAKLPHGLDTEMTREFDDDGTMLSGGESQKVAISRMFAKSLLTASTKPNATASDIEASPAGATPNGYASSCAHGATASDIKTGPAGLNIAILDEPSSALDPRAESALNKNMLAVTANAAVIFISHRLSTTRDADRIYLFERGRIVEQGTHEELMQLNGGYAAMFEKQAHYYQEEA